MKFLLDTHALLWWLSDDPLLSQTARDTILERSHAIHVSAASAWEIATKFRKGKLPTGNFILPDFSRVIADEGFINLPLTSEHMVRSALLPGNHQDPFDRMLAAQAILENMTLLSVDSQILQFGVVMRW